MEGLNNSNICPNCGWTIDNKPESNLHLSPGSVLQNKYLIGKVIGQGGFGITYIAWDLNLNLKLAIKEFLPVSMAHRAADRSTVSIINITYAEYFNYGLDKFLTEARMLARFNDHPNIVSVRDYFRANETAYLVMNYIDGITLEELMSGNSQGLSMKQAIGIMTPIMDALKELHKIELLHRDISPSNILINKNGQVILADFGAARQSIGGQGQGLSVVVKPGYAPEEQYRSNSIQGPWTDVYAIAATIYHMVTCILPVESLDRLMKDSLVSPSERGIQVKEFQEKALLKALSVRADDRYQTVEEFQQELLGFKNREHDLAESFVAQPLNDKADNGQPEIRIEMDDNTLAQEYGRKIELERKHIFFPLIKNHVTVLVSSILILLFIALSTYVLDWIRTSQPYEEVEKVFEEPVEISQEKEDDSNKDKDIPSQVGGGIITPPQPKVPQNEISVPADYNTIQKAIDNAESGSVIIVQPGVYNENIDFKGKSVRIESIYPYDLEIVQSTIIDGGKKGSVVTFKNGENNSAVINGFTIRGGGGTRDSFEATYDGSTNIYRRVYGGGIYIANHSSPTISNNIIEDNAVHVAQRGVFGIGGAIAVLNYSHPVIENNYIRGNYAEGYAGGIAVWYNSSPHLLNNVIENNSADDIGGGVFVAMDCSPKVRGNVINGNTSQSGGGVYIAHGSSGSYIDNYISENKGYIGGGLLVWSTKDVMITNNTIEMNRSQQYGGGIFVGNDSNLSIAGNSFENNSSSNGGALWVAKGCSVNNSVSDDNIFLDNTPDNIVFSQTEGPTRLPWP